MCFLFVSFNACETLDTKRPRSFQHSNFDKSNLGQPSWWLHNDLLFSGRFSLLLVAQHPLSSPLPKQMKMNKVCLCVSIKVLD
jgi:hypothetical protein